MEVISEFSNVSSSQSSKYTDKRLHVLVLSVVIVIFERAVSAALGASGPLSNTRYHYHSRTKYLRYLGEAVKEPARCCLVKARRHWCYNISR